MNSRGALELAGVWLGAHQVPPQGGSELRAWFARELEGAIPEDSPAGVALVDQVPHVLALIGDLLIVTRMEHTSDGQLAQETLAVPLSPKPSLTVSGQISADQKNRARKWVLKPLIGETLTIETSEVLRAMFSSDVRPDSGEALMRIIAAQLGWKMDSP